MARKSDPFAPALTPELVVRAYSAGVFPMAEDAASPEVFWVCPPMRGILPLDTFHVSRSLQKLIRRHSWQVRSDTDFDAVIEGCATAGEDRDSTWINADIRRVYRQLFDRGQCHTVEVWDGQQLVGGLYGVSLGAVYFGESMFHRATGASKVALAHLIERLRTGGYRLCDTQFVSDHLRTFGGIEIPHEEYEMRLANALAHTADWYAMDLKSSGLHSSGRSDA